ncbi:hypothetical protein [Hufsiella ginkgonis]|uniref:XRE family transcriptional regulator n=1 Tax=Hufsiella ginkgonis TaxID=2695274 RepID=A0A7K1XV78_9SPHI|nr:hypothetical protein [Hufsiella ginkgonis]MXV14901.1 hypothetical protein [Hufsiella ginkgonis]
MYKYRLHDLLDNLPKKDFNKAMRVIPKVLGVSFNTFLNYRNIKLADQRDIPHQKVLILEKIFGLNHGELDNFKIECKHISQLLNEDTG